MNEIEKMIRALYLNQARIHQKIDLLLEWAFHYNSASKYYEDKLEKINTRDFWDEMMDEKEDDKNETV